MKLHKIPIVTAALLLSLALPVFAHGRGGRGGGRGGGGGPRMSAGGGIHRGGAFVGPRGGTFGGPRGFVGPRGNFGVIGSRGAFIGRPGFAGNRFNRFDRFNRFNRGGNNVFVYGGGYPFYYYPAYSYPDRANYQYPRSYYYGTSTSPVANAAAPVGEYAPVQMSAGDVVANVQQALRNRGFYSGPIDGLSGGATRAAIRSYAAAIGLPSNGAIDSNLLASLGLM